MRKNSLHKGFFLILLERGKKESAKEDRLSSVRVNAEMEKGKKKLLVRKTSEQRSNEGRTDMQLQGARTIYGSLPIYKIYFGQFFKQVKA